MYGISDTDAQEMAEGLFDITKEKVQAIMEEFGDTTESLYLHIADNYDFRKLTKKKATQLLKAKI